jgi:hypothetical protein
VRVRFPCPECERPGRLESPGPAEWACPSCDHVTRLAGPADPSVPACPVCGNAELYKKKDFSHALGMGILLLGLAGATLSYWLYDKWLYWAILIGSAALDGVLYLLVKDVIVCYRCGAHVRGVPPGPHHKPFELTVHERYRQERIRREELAARQQQASEAITTRPG